MTTPGEFRARIGFTASLSGWAPGAEPDPAGPRRTVRRPPALLAAAAQVPPAYGCTVRNDSAVDIDGGIDTLGVHASMGATLGERRHLL